MTKQNQAIVSSATLQVPSDSPPKPVIKDILGGKKKIGLLPFSEIPTTAPFVLHCFTKGFPHWKHKTIHGLSTDPSEQVTWVKKKEEAGSHICFAKQPCESGQEAHRVAQPDGEHSGFTLPEDIRLLPSLQDPQTCLRPPKQASQCTFRQGDTRCCGQWIRGKAALKRWSLPRFEAVFSRWNSIHFSIRGSL